MGIFSTKINHSKYFESNLEELAEKPGFPFLRINLEIKNKEGHLTSDEEHLLLAMHARSSGFLVLSNKKIAVYKIPVKKSFYKKTIGMVLDQVPVVSDVLDGLESLNSLRGGVKNFKGWITGANKREAARREAEGMPSKKDYKGVIWNLTNEAGLAMILSYRAEILLANGFVWGTVFKTPLEENVNLATEITLRHDGIFLKAGKKKASVNFPKSEFDYYNTIKALAEQHKIHFSATN